MRLSGIRNSNLCIYQGDDFACIIRVFNRADGCTSDLTDFTAQSQIRTGPADETPGSVAANMICTVLVPNLVSLWLPREQTRTLKDIEYVWDLQITSSAGHVSTILSGDCHVLPEVTRSEWRGHLWDAVVASQPLWRPVQVFRSPSQPALRLPWGRNDPWG